MLALMQVPTPLPECQPDRLAPPAVEERALERFAAAIDDYVALHHRLETPFPEKLFDDAEEMFAVRDALRSALVRARRHAQQGNIFTPDVAVVITRALDRTIRELGYDPTEILADITADREPGVRDPEVNEPYPWSIGSSMWPAFLRALPPLPPELEYRFAERDLVLIDIHANLVVDVLQDALPPAGSYREDDEDR
jgi:hypothetical protein